ncbi:MAG: hypothetical protein CL573_08760 [Alphaproteobacteria bacterium]|nr:hypothetical protein [Alphaproteobacteria bacterium]
MAYRVSFAQKTVLRPLLLIAAFKAATQHSIARIGVSAGNRRVLPDALRMAMNGSGMVMRGRSGPEVA